MLIGWVHREGGGGGAEEAGDCTDGKTLCFSTHTTA